MVEWSWSQWIIIPLLFVTCAVVSVGLIGLLFGPFIAAGWQVARDRVPGCRDR